MFDWVDMDIVDMALEISFVADGVLPVATLPDARSPFAARLAEMLSPPGMRRENADFINRQRVAKSASPSGSVQTVWKWSGSTTIASTVKG